MIQLLKYGNTNCYYIKGKNGSLLVDTEIYYGHHEQTISNIKKIEDTLDN